jgi:hypothetical protein
VALESIGDGNLANNLPGAQKVAASFNDFVAP